MGGAAVDEVEAGLGYPGRLVVFSVGHIFGRGGMSHNLFCLLLVHSRIVNMQSMVRWVVPNMNLNLPYPTRFFRHISGRGHFV